MTKPIAVTMGDPAGIGPECVAKSWHYLRSDPELAFFAIGDPSLYDAPTQIIGDPNDCHEVFAHALPIIPLHLNGGATLGKPSTDHAAMVIESITKAVEYCTLGLAKAVMTAPISKSILKDGADFPYPGHTEFLAHLGGEASVAMMLASQELRVIPVTIHIPLKDVPSTLNTQMVFDTISLAHRELRTRFNIQIPRIAVSGLNPHAGENGHMGIEDTEIVLPAIRAAQDAGMDVRGPLPADTMFHARARQGYDVAICMYHDQALIPIKTLDFDRGVNVTFGLPFVRTSPDHGTAFDIAGRDLASPLATIEAIKMAATLGQG